MPLFEDLNLSLSEGQRLAVIGQSGCGKTTLLKLICGLLKPTSGTVTAKAAALQPQNDQLLPWRTALTNATLPLEIAGHKPKAARKLVAPLFKNFGLSGCEDQLAAQLSGGMKQRVAFIRTLAIGRPLLALDEPFSALDALNRHQLQLWLKDSLTQQPRSVIFVTHDIEEALQLADRIVVLSKPPSTVICDISIDPQQRQLGSSSGAQLRQQLLDLLGSNQQQAAPR